MALNTAVSGQGIADRKKKVQPIGLEQGALNLAVRLSKTPTSLLGAAENYVEQRNVAPIAAGSTTIRAVPSLRTSPLEKGLPGMDAANLKAYQTRTAPQEALAPEAISAALPGGKLAKIAKRAIPLAAAIGAGITASSRLPAQDTSQGIQRAGAYRDAPKAIGTLQADNANYPEIETQPVTPAVAPAIEPPTRFGNIMADGSNPTLTRMSNGQLPGVQPKAASTVMRRSMRPTEPI